MVIPDEVREALVAHAEAELPNEACGLVAFRDGVAERYLPAVNATPSPYRFELQPRDPADFFLEDEGYELAVFHSHVSSPAHPSRTDVENIGQWEGRPYLILSLRTRDLAAFAIERGEIRPLELR